jgi:hypothetical protein
MDKKLAGLLGAAAALTAVSGAQAAAPAQSTEAAPAASYRELLDPVPNALAALMTDEAQHAKARASGETQLAYHHHHHHGWRGKLRFVYCGPVLRHAAEPTQAANCRSSTAS